MTPDTHPVGTVRDPNGTFRKDLRILHVRVLPDCPVEEFNKISERFQQLKLDGLDAHYITVVTTSIDMNIFYVEEFLKRLERESVAFKTPEVIDSLITGLKSIRDKRWADDDRRKEQQANQGQAVY